MIEIKGRKQERISQNVIIILLIEKVLDSVNKLK